MTESQRYWSKVDTTSDCWLWMASLDRHGYGQFRVGNRTRRAHHISWEESNGPLPKGLEIDHLCKTPACVRPTHLEAVTHAINLQRSGHKNRGKTHCKRGHAFDAVNTYTFGKMRQCRTCHLMHSAQSYARKQGKQEVKA